MREYTHYYIVPNSNKLTIFGVGTCDRCGAQIILPNAVGGIQSEIWKYKREGLKEWKGEQPEYALPETYPLDGAPYECCGACVKPGDTCDGNPIA